MFRLLPSVYGMHLAAPAKVAADRCTQWGSSALRSIQASIHSDVLAYAVPISIVLSAFSIATGSYAHSVLSSLPDASDPRLWNPDQSVYVYDRNGGILYTAFKDEDRVLAPHDEIPDLVRHAFIAVEDKRFFEREGCIDMRAIGRAVIANIQKYKSQGASTITQQLARTAFLDRGKRFERKIREILLACKLEGSLAKNEILDLYLNWISFGSTIHGIHQASWRYFATDPSKLTVAQAAILASLPQRPTYFSPYGDHRYTSIDSALLHGAAQSGALINGPEDIPPEAITIGLTGTMATIGSGRVYVPGRADFVIAAMHEQGYIDDEERRRAVAQLKRIRFHSAGHGITAPYYVLESIDAAARMTGTETEEFIRHGGIDIQTTLDPFLQAMAEHAVLEHAKRVKDRFDVQNVAALLIDRRTSEILAYVGNTDYFSSSSGAQIDMIRSPRQPGSSFKPLVYAYAMEKFGWKPYTILHDSPITINGYRPSNYDGSFKGPMSMLFALNYSRNIPAIETYRKIDDEDGLLRFIAETGAPAPLQQKERWADEGSDLAYGWPLAIGSAEVPLLEMVQAYATFANAGIMRPVHGITEVRSASGRTIVSLDVESTQVMPPDIANTVTSILSEPASRPAGFWRNATTLPGIDAAVKTGTSNVCVKRTSARCLDRRPRDIWAIGYTPEYVLGVWMGNADGTPLQVKADGLTGAVPLWKDILLNAHALRGNGERLFAKEQAPYFRFHKPPQRKTDIAADKPRTSYDQLFRRNAR